MISKMEFPAVHAVQFVEVEAALQRVGLGEGDYRDANLLRAVFQQLEGKIRELEAMVEKSPTLPKHYVLEIQDSELKIGD